MNVDKENKIINKTELINGIIQKTSEIVETLKSNSKLEKKETLSTLITELQSDYASLKKIDSNEQFVVFPESKNLIQKSLEGIEVENAISKKITIDIDSTETIESQLKNSQDNNIDDVISNLSELNKTINTVSQSTADEKKILNKLLLDVFSKNLKQLNSIDSVNKNFKITTEVIQSPQKNNKITTNQDQTVAKEKKYKLSNISEALLIEENEEKNNIEVNNNSTKLLKIISEESGIENTVFEIKSSQSVSADQTLKEFGFYNKLNSNSDISSIPNLDILVNNVNEYIVSRNNTLSTTNLNSTKKLETDIDTAVHQDKAPKFISNENGDIIANPESLLSELTESDIIDNQSNKATNTYSTSSLSKPIKTQPTTVSPIGEIIASSNSSTIDIQQESKNTTLVEFLPLLNAAVNVFNILGTGFDLAGLINTGGWQANTPNWLKQSSSYISNLFGLSTVDLMQSTMKNLRQAYTKINSAVLSMAISEANVKNKISKNKSRDIKSIIKTANEQRLKRNDLFNTTSNFNGIQLPINCGYIKIYELRGPKFEFTESEVKYIPMQFEPEIENDSKSAEYSSFTTIGRSDSSMVYRYSQNRNLHIKLNYLVTGPNKKDKASGNIFQAESESTKGMIQWDEEYIYDFIIPNFRNFTKPNIKTNNYKLAPILFQVYYGTNVEDAKTNQIFRTIWNGYSSNSDVSKGSGYSSTEYLSLWICNNIAFSYSGGYINVDNKHRNVVQVDISMTEVAPSVVENQIYGWKQQPELLDSLAGIQGKTTTQTTTQPETITIRRETTIGDMASFSIF